MTTTIPAGGTHEYLSDRYDRLRNAAEILASDPAVENADQLCNSGALRLYIKALADERVLAGLSEDDADTVGMLVTLDFLKGPAQIAGRISDWLEGNRFERDDDDTWAVCAVMAEALTVYLTAFASPEFAERRATERWPNRG